MKKVLLVLMMGIPLSLMAQTSITTTPNSSSKKEVPNSSDVQVKSQIAELPGFPVYENSGNTEAANANYQAAKEKWIKENQELYNNYVASLGAPDSKIGLTDLPGFPQFVNTGNAEADNANYREAKILWIQNNQDLYNSYTKAPAANNNTRRSSTK